MRVPSSDDVSVAVHDFGGSGRPLILSHATGFHAHCYRPLADRLSDTFHSFAHDHRGHGDTERPDDWQVDWDRYGDDALAAAQAVAAGQDGARLVGFGHSMGGASLIMAARRQPELFDVIIAYEPIIFPQRMAGEISEPSPMVTAARNRRSTFDSLQAAIDNYAAKPPMQFFDTETLRLYVEHGFVAADGGADVGSDGSVELRCAPEHEARTFETGAGHDLWELLPDIETRIVVVSGKVDEERSPAGVAGPVAERLANATYIELDDGNHLTPFIDPDRIAALIRRAAT